MQHAVPTNSRNRSTWHPCVGIDFIRLDSVTTNRKNGLTGEQLAVGNDSRSVSTGLSLMFSVATEGCHVRYSREFVGTVYCTIADTIRRSNTTKHNKWGHQLSRLFIKDSKSTSVYSSSKQSGRSPKVAALFSATNFSSNIIELLQLHDTIQIKWNYA